MKFILVIVRLYGDLHLLQGYFPIRPILHVKIISNPSARYFKLIAKSEINNKAWTAVAELGIEASAIVTPIGEACDNLLSDQKYYIKDIASGLYLQWKHDIGSNYEGEFCINP